MVKELRTSASYSKTSPLASISHSHWFNYTQQSTKTPSQQTVEAFEEALIVLPFCWWWSSPHMLSRLTSAGSCSSLCLQVSAASSLSEATQLCSSSHLRTVCGYYLQNQVPNGFPRRAGSKTLPNAHTREREGRTHHYFKKEKKKKHSTRFLFQEIAQECN